MEILKYLITGCPNERTLLYSLGNRAHPAGFRVGTSGVLGGTHEVELRELIVTDHPQVWGWAGRSHWRELGLPVWGLCHTHFRNGIFLMSLPSFELSAAGDVKEAQEASFQHIHDVELAIPQTNTDFVEGFSSTAFPSCHDALRRDVRATFRARSREVGDPVSITLDRIDRLYDSWVFRGTRRLSGREKRVVSGWHRDGDKYAVISDSGYGYELPYFALSESMRQLSSL